MTSQHLNESYVEKNYWNGVGVQVRIIIIMIIIIIQKKNQTDVKSTLKLHRRTFIFYLVCRQCFKSTKNNSLFIQYQSPLHFRSIKYEKSKPLTMWYSLIPFSNYHKTFLSLVINKNEHAQQPWQFLSSLAKKRQINFNDFKYQLKGELFQVPVMQILIIINNWILILTYKPGVGSKV